MDNTGNVDLTNVVLDGRVCRRRRRWSAATNDNSILETTETWVYRADYAVTQADLNAGAALVNVAAVDTAQTARQQDDATSTVTQSPSLTIVKADQRRRRVVDTAGETIEYTITVDNTGNVDLTDVVLTDVFAGGATLVSGDTNGNSILETTETWVYSADYTVTQADLNAGAALVNVAAVDTAPDRPAAGRRHLHGGAEPVADDREVAANADDAVVDRRVRRSSTPSRWTTPATST